MMKRRSAISSEGGAQFSAAPEAIYNDDNNDLWAGNPLIESLPAQLSDKQFARAVNYLPHYTKEMRLEPKETRINYINRTLQFLLPSQNHILLYQRISRVIRDGYIARNPVQDRGWNRLHQQLEEIQTLVKYGVAPHQPSMAFGFAVLGMSGLGKTVGIDTVLRIFPQVIRHTTYKNHGLHFPQLVWLKLDCPEDGSLKALILSFFVALDQMFGQRYAAMYYKDTRSSAQMLPDVVRLASVYHLGVLIIDEIQALSRVRSGGGQVMLQFFTRLMNTIKVPVILIGTPLAEDLLSSALHQMRRNAGQGILNWRPMERDGEYKRFIKALWHLQFTTQSVALSKDLENKLYTESFGIADFACKIYMLAQERAINTDQPITVELLEQVAIDGLGRGRDVLAALQAKNPKYPSDKRPSDVKFSVGQARVLELARNAGSGRPATDLANTTSAPEADRDATQPLAQPPVLVALGKEAKRTAKAAHAVLLEAGLIRPITEYALE